MHHLRRYLWGAVAMTAVAAILRRMAVMMGWELPSQVGTMILFSPLLACVAIVAWQPYSAQARLRLNSILFWLLSLGIATCFFFLWNWIFHDGVFDRQALIANAYHWGVYFCVAWICLRAFAAISASWFIARLKPDPIRLIDLFIGLTLGAIVMACFRVVPTIGQWSSYPAMTQFVHAAWGAIMFSVLWIALALAIGNRAYRVWIIAGIVLATAGARIASPYATAQIEGYSTDRKIVIVAASTPEFLQRSFSLPELPEKIGYRTRLTEARLVNIPRVEERIVEAIAQVASILIVMLLITAKPVTIDAAKLDLQTFDSEEIDS
jgi:hypothetical protein